MPNRRYPQPDLYPLAELNATPAGLAYADPSQTDMTKKAITLIDHACAAMDKAPDVPFTENREAWAGRYFLGCLLQDDRNEAKPRIFPQLAAVAIPDQDTTRTVDMFDYVTHRVGPHKILSKRLKNELADHRRYIEDKGFHIASATVPQGARLIYSSDKGRPAGPKF